MATDTSPIWEEFLEEDTSLLPDELVDELIKNRVVQQLLVLSLLRDSYLIQREVEKRVSDLLLEELWKRVPKEYQFEMPSIHELNLWAERIYESFGSNLIDRLILSSESKSPIDSVYLDLRGAAVDAIKNVLLSNSMYEGIEYMHGIDRDYSNKKILAGPYAFFNDGYTVMALYENYNQLKVFLDGGEEPGEIDWNGAKVFVFIYEPETVIVSDIYHNLKNDNAGLITFVN